MRIDEKYLEEHLITYCKRCSISCESKEAFHYKMRIKHRFNKIIENH